MKNKIWLVLGLILTAAFRSSAFAADTVCAVVNLELGQQSALEREGFNAKLALTNNLGDLPLSGLSITVNIADTNGNAADHLFFIKITDLENIAAIDGTGVVQPGGKAVIKWLLIPSAGAGGTAPGGVRYNATARMTYYTGGVPRQTTTIPATITVKPQPMLRLEYVLPFEVFGDDPLTTLVESTEPFPLGLRVSNVGAGTAKNFQVMSGQPKITVNEQGLVANFQILGNWLGANSLPEKTFDIAFGDIAPGASKQAAWSLASSLSGRFTDFSASFTHSAELGGALTSLIESASTYTLIKDVLADLPGRDAQFDFLVNKSLPRSLLEGMYQRGEEPEPEFLMESDQAGLTPVLNVAAHLTGSLSGSNSVLHLAYELPPPANTWVHATLSAPEGGVPVLSVIRADGKLINSRNVWISKHYNKATQETVRHLHILDYTGSQAADYAMTFSAAAMDTAPSAITDLAAYSAGNGVVGLTWTAAGEDGSSGTVYGGHYAIFYSTDNGVAPSSSSAQILLTTTTTAGAAQKYVLPGLLGNTAYQFAVYMADALGQYSAVSNIFTAQTAVLPPAGTENVAIATTTLNISWLAANNALPVEYGVSIDTDAVEPVVLASPFKAPLDRSFEFAGLTPNTTYLFYGLAKNPETGSMSAQAALGSAVTLAAQPGQLISSSVFVSSLTFAWDVSGNPAGTEYFVQLSTVAGWASIAGESGWIARTDYSFGDLAQNTTYYARAKAKNSAGVETAYTDLGMLKTKFFDTLPPASVVSFAGPSFGPGPVYVSSLTAISLTASDDVLAAGDKLGAVASVQYSVDSDTFTVYSGSFSVVAGGAHVVRYYSVDTVGNTEAVKTLSITVDDVPPVAAVELSSQTYSFGGIDYMPGSSIVTLAASDTLAGVKALYYELSGSTYSVQAASQVFNLAEGAYSLAYSAADNLGNTSVLRVSSIAVDNTAPATVFGVLGSSAVLNGGLYLTAGSSVSLTAADALSGVKEVNYSLDGSIAVAASPLALPVTVGEHTLAFYSEDNVGNSELQKSVTFFVDSEAPVTTAAVAGTAGSTGWYVSPVVLTLASTDTMSGVEYVKYSLERAGSASERVLLSSGVYAAPLTVNEEGVYNYSYSAADRAGNISPETTGYLNIDLSTPVIVALFSPAANAYAWNNGMATVVFTGTDSISGIAFCTPEVLLKTEGSSQTISGYCSDYAGLSSTASLTINIDTTAPVVSYARVPAASTDGWNNSEVTVNFTCSDALSGVASCPAGIILASEGANISTAAAAYDFAGNPFETIASGINIDRTAPVSTASLSGIYENGYYSGAVEVTITSTDTLSGVFKTYYSLDGAALIQYQGPIPVSVEGLHTVRYYAQDKAGNEEAARTFEFAIDHAGPSVYYSLVPPPNAAGWNNSPVEIVFAGTDTLSGISACSSGTVTSEGFAQEVTGWCRDLAGNIGYATATVSIDLTKPVIEISSPTAGAVFSAGGGKFQVGLTVVDDLDLTPSVTVQLTQTEDRGVPRGSAAASIVVINGQLVDAADLDDGIWQLEAAAKDMAGNSTQTVSGLFEIVHDTIAPQTSLAVGAPKFTAGRSAFITSHTPLLFSATDDMLIAGDRGGAGVAATYIYIDSQAVAFSTGVFVAAESTHTVSYFSVDLAGNREAANAAVFAVDDSSPASAIAFSSGAASGTDGFVIPEGSAVSFTAADLPAGAASGVSAIWYSVDSGTATVFSGAFSLAAGSHTVVYWSMDNLGNTEGYKTVLVSVSAPGWSVKLNLEPSTLNLNSKGEAVTAKLWFEGSGQGCFKPETLNINSINGQTLAKPIYAQSPGQRHGRADKVECGAITVKFDRDALISVLPVNAVSKITVAGALDDGRAFSAEDTVRTMKPRRMGRGNGGHFEHRHRACFDAPAGALKGDADLYVLSIEGDKDENESRKEAAGKTRQVARRGYAYEFGPDGSVFDKPLTISLPYDGDEKNPGNLAIAWWNENSRLWELLPSRFDASARLIKADVAHFSQYQVVIASYAVSIMEPVKRFRVSEDADVSASLADPTFKLGEVYVYPNPAKGGKVPIFHIEVGVADTVKIRIYTVSGQLAHDTTLAGMPRVIGSVYAYEYAWEGRIASGVYYYTVEASNGGRKIKTRGKFAVIR